MAEIEAVRPREIHIDLAIDPIIRPGSLPGRPPTILLFSRRSAECEDRSGERGRTAKTARDQVAPDGPEIDYPQRELIGFAPSDEAMLLNAFIDHAGDALGWGRRAGR